MPLYDYEALDSTGRKVADLIEAGNAEIAQTKLTQRGLSITSLTERKAGITPGGRVLPTGNVPAPARRMDPVAPGMNLAPVIVGVGIGVVALGVWGASQLMNKRSADPTGPTETSNTSDAKAAAGELDPNPPIRLEPPESALAQPDQTKAAETLPSESTTGTSSTSTAPAVVLTQPETQRPPPPIPATRALKNGRHAVIVGINQYADSSISTLSTAERDAESLHKLLIDPEAGGVPPENATLLVGAQATRVNVIAALAQKKRISPESTVFIYFSGHGMTDGSDGYLLMHDSQTESLEATAISNTDLTVRLGEIPSERKVVILDSCHAAAAIKGAKTKGVADLLARFSAKGRATLTASQQDELALDVPALGNSLYTHFLIRGLRGEADMNADGVVVLTELTAFLEQHVRNEARARGGKQTPGQSIDVDVASEFLLTVQPEKRKAFEAKAAEEQQVRERRVQKLKDLVLDNKVSQAHGNEGRRLLEASPASLTEREMKLLKEYIDLVEDRLLPEKLEAALNFVRGS